MCKLLVIQGMVSFIAVFLKGFQHQNVIGGKYTQAFFVSYLMATAEVALVTFVVKVGWLSVIPVGTGAAIGITLSMWVYRFTEKRGVINTFISLIFKRK